MPNGYMQGTNGQLIEIIDAAAREGLAKKLPAPETAKVGDYLRIEAVNADGSFTVAAVAAPTVPTKVSELTNDAGYQTEAQVNALIAAVPTFKKQVVSELPETGEDNTLYLVPFAAEDGQFLEYLYVNGAWEVIGNGVGSGENAYVLPVGGDELGGVKNGGNVTINADGTMTAPDNAPTDEQVSNSVENYFDKNPDKVANVADKSVTPAKTDFLEIRAVSEPEAVTLESGGYNLLQTVEYIDIQDVDTLVTIHQTSAPSAVVRIALYDAELTAVQTMTQVSSTANQSNTYNASAEDALKWTVTTRIDVASLRAETGAVYAKVRFAQNSANAYEFAVYRGDIQTEGGFMWADKYGSPKLPDGAVTLAQTTFEVVTGANLIDMTRFENSGYSGDLFDQFGSNKTVFADIVDVSANKNVFVRRRNEGAGTDPIFTVVGCYDADMAYLGGGEELVTVTLIRDVSDIVYEDSVIVSGGHTVVHRYVFSDEVKYARFGGNQASAIASTYELDSVITSYDDILDMTSAPEKYWRDISAEWATAIKRVVAPAPATMVMIGDSLTHWGGGGDAADGFLKIVHDKTGVLTSNEGQAGAWWQLMDGETVDGVSTNGVGRVNTIIADGRKYDLYCFMLGTNAGATADTGETSADPSTMPGAIRYCMEKLKAYDPTGRILVCLPPQREEGNESQEKVNEVIKTIVESYGVCTLDIYHHSGIVPNTKIADVGYLSDGLHLGDNGIQALGDTLAAEVKYMLCL